MVWRGIFFLAWLGMMVLGGFSIYETIFPKYILNDISIPMKIVVITISAFYIVVGIARFLFLFAKDERMVIIDSEKGNLGVNLSAIENLAKGIAKSQNYISDASVKSKVKGGNVKLKISITSKTVKDLNLQIKKLQDLVVNEIQLKTGLDIESVDIITKKIIYNSAEINENVEDKNEKNFYSAEVDMNE